MTELPFNSYRGDDDYVFVSYAHKDSGTVFEYLKRLKNIGFNVWYDEGIEPGDIWRDTLANAISNSSAVIYFVSEASVASDNCANEINFALDQGRTILCVYIEPARLSAGLQLSLSGRQAILAHDCPPEEFDARVQIALTHAELRATVAVAQPQTENFDDILAAAATLLENEKRMTYRSLRRRLSIDEDYLEDICDELIHAKRIAADEDGRVIVFTGIATEESRAPEPATAPEPIESTEPEAAQEPAAERRRLHCVGARLVPHLASDDPEQSRELAAQFNRQAREVIAANGGTVFRDDQQELYAYFGYPVMHEDEAERAIRCGLILAEIATNQFQVATAAHMGLCVVDRQGLAGNPVQQITELVKAAPTGTLLISEVSQRRVATHFDTQAVSPVGDLDTFQVIGASRVRGFVSHTQAVPLVGREQELALMQSRLAAAQNGAGQVVLLSGEPAIGKSRLVYEMLNAPEAETATKLEFHFSAALQASALAPIVDTVERAVGITSNDDAERRKELVEAAVTGLGDQADQVAEATLEFLSLAAYEDTDIKPEVHREQLFTTFSQVLIGLARDNLLVMVWEDLHWADPTTLELLGLLIPQMGETNMLMLLTFRPEFVPPWPTRPFVSQLALAGLDQDGVDQIVASITEGRRLPNGVSREILEKTDGVPLFVEELTKSLIDSNVLRETPDGFELTQNLASLDLPGTLADLLVARLDGMGPAKVVAQVASVIGREFDKGVLELLLTMDAQELERALSQLVHAELLLKRLQRGASSYVFKHALVRDAAYDSLLNSARQNYHKLTADLFCNELADQSSPELIAYHYARSDQPELAIPHAREAGQLALDQAANVEALRHLEQARDLITSLPEGTERYVQELSLCMQMGPAIMAVRGYSAPEVGTNYRRARELVALVPEQTDLYPIFWGLWAMHYVGGQLFEAGEMSEQVYEIARTTGDVTLIPPACHAVAYTETYRGRYESALAAVEEGLSHFSMELELANTMRFQLSSTISIYAAAAESLWMTGEAAAAQEMAEKMVPLAHALEHPTCVAVASTLESLAAQHRGDAEAIIRCNATVREVASEDEPFWPALANIYLSWLPALDGEHRKAVADIRAAHNAYRATGGGILTTLAFYMMAESYLAENDTEGVLAMLAEAEAWIEISDEHHMYPELLRVVALAIFDDDPEEAFAKINRASSIAAQQGAVWSEMRCELDKARLLARQNKQMEAVETIKQICVKIPDSKCVHERREAEVLLASLDT